MSLRYTPPVAAPGDSVDLLALTLAPGVGPVMCARLLEAFGDAARARRATPGELARIKGIGDKTAHDICRALASIDGVLARELEAIEACGARLIARDHEGYPPLLNQTPRAPALLYARGEADWLGDDRFPVAIVGSRECTAYGIEQAERFASALASAGLTVVSGGARGIDAAAHRGAMRAGGRTVAVPGSGLATLYPPENAPIFNAILNEGRGQVISELPARTPPAPENFPARNRIIAGLALGVLVIEAGGRSGALITARDAADLGRDVFALPGRVDSLSSAGTHDLLKRGEALLVTEPGDVIAGLEAAGRHLHQGTHAARFTPSPLFDSGSRESRAEPRPVGTLPAESAAILHALREERTLDELVVATGLAPELLRTHLTQLEILGRVSRRGGRFVVRAR